MKEIKLNMIKTKAKFFLIKQSALKNTAQVNEIISKSFSNLSRLQSQNTASKVCM